MSYKVLVINPGSTTTKIAVYEDDKALFTKNVEHDAAKIAEFASIPDQAPFRAECIFKTLAAESIDEKTLDCIMCRGGLLMEPPIKSGGYIVNEDLCTALADENLTSPHASLLGGLLGKEFSDKLGIPAYIYDAVSAGELSDIAMMTGFAEIKRRSFAHVLNGRAMAIKYAASIGKKIEDLNIIVAHMGGGCSVAAYKGGVLIDSVSDDEQHMSAERSGGAPLLMFIKLCFSGKYTAADVKKLVRGKGGMAAHLGTSDGREVEKMAAEGNEKATLVMDALAYGLAKSIGEMSVTFKGKTDAIILTGGLAYSKYITGVIKEYASSIAPVEVLAGESEMSALAEGGIRLMKGEEKAGVYKLPEGYKK
jgi:butyrate kinase